jgi:hypothetical protein
MSAWMAVLKFDFKQEIQLLERPYLFLTWNCIFYLPNSIFYQVVQVMFPQPKIWPIWIINVKCSFFAYLFVGSPVVAIQWTNSQPFRASQKLILEGSVVGGYVDNSSFAYLWSEVSGQLSLRYLCSSF